MHAVNNELECIVITCNLGKVLRLRGVTQRSVFEATGISKTTLSHMANDQNAQINLRILSALCQHLNITPGDLLTYTPDPPKEQGE